MINGFLFLKIFITELVLSALFVYALFWDMRLYEERIFRKPKKKKEIKLRGKNYPFD